MALKSMISASHRHGYLENSFALICCRYGKGESILIVDDSPEQRALAQRMMQRLGYEVYTAASGEEAVSLVNKRQYDLLILDMIMPPGMDGLETYKQILEIVPESKSGHCEWIRHKRTCS
jgi:PleD family two-component response regulator